jgi:hypothetical protein
MGGFHMDKKVCTNCKVEKEIENFGKRGKNGYRSDCKECERLKNRLYHKNNKEKIQQRKNKYYNTDIIKNKLSEYRKKKRQEYINNCETPTPQTKICTKCNIEKNIDSFGIDTYKKDGYLSNCKTCRSEYDKIYHAENAEDIRKRKNKYYQTEVGQEYRQKYSKKCYQQNKEQLLLDNKLWREENKEYRKQYYKNYSNNNREKINAYDRKRRKSSVKIRLDEALSRQISASLRKFGSSKKNIGWEKAVGYTVTQLIKHLELKFKPEMNWDNYGSYWHVDHIVPKSWFKYSSCEDEAFKKCWSLDNLQPLEATENHKKGNRYAG